MLVRSETRRKPDSVGWKGSLRGSDTKQLQEKEISIIKAQRVQRQQIEVRGPRLAAGYDSCCPTTRASWWHGVGLGNGMATGARRLTLSASEELQREAAGEQRCLLLGVIW